MRIALGSDHAGFELKQRIAGLLAELGHEVMDLGVRSAEPADYPDFARKVAVEVAQERAERGIVVCGSGVGASVAANKVPGVRAGLCHDPFSARQCVEDDDVNVLCLGGRVVGCGLAFEIVKTWLAASFSGAERHVRRLEKLLAIEDEFMNTGSRAARKPRRTAVPAGERQGAGERDPFGAAAEKGLEKLAAARFLERLRGKDASLFKSDPAHQKIIRGSLGWLTLPDSMGLALGSIRNFAAEVRAEGFEKAVVLGMGGSSLSCEVFRRCFPAAPGHPGLLVLDSTNPGAVRALASSLNLKKTLFVVSSKSGSTIEPNCMLEHFFAEVSKAAGAKAPRQFVAITDPGSSMEKLARRREFRKVFLNPPDVGGRYSVLSYFGLVPAALMGVDVGLLMERARRQALDPAAGLRLGAALGTLAREGRDKMLLSLSPGVASFGLWIEQLVAESTGKEGLGIVPVCEPGPGKDDRARGDQVRVRIELSSDGGGGTGEALERLGEEGCPVARLDLADAYDLGAQFYSWEIATAAAGFLLGVNPFDQPDVQSAKDQTKALLGRLKKGRLPEETASFQAGGLAAHADDGLIRTLGARRGDSLPLAAVLDGHFGRARGGDYVAILAFMEETPETAALLEETAREGRSRGFPVTLEFGPRYLHSTGQLYKGGPASGIFLLLTEPEAASLPVPGEEYGFGVLHGAQARGDFAAMKAAGRRILRLDLKRPVQDGLRALLNALRAPADGNGPGQAGAPKRAARKEA